MEESGTAAEKSYAYVKTGDEENSSDDQPVSYTHLDTIILTNSLSLKLSNFNKNCQKNKKHADHKKMRSLELQL